MIAPEELQAIQLDVRGRAAAAGLDFFEVVFEMVDAAQMNAVAAYGGLPSRYPHWRFGMEYESLSKTYTYGFSKIYEMVVNNDPCFAYLLRANSPVEQKLVMAHVYGHADFFKQNVFYAKTNRKMIDQAGSHRAKIYRLMTQFGQDTVEDFIDLCLSLESLIDINSAGSGSPEDPESPKDILLHLLKYAPLKLWQQEVLAIIRAEAYYFAPQRQTKIMNEGWACFWHSRLMTGGLVESSEIIDYADRHAGSMQMGGAQINPYKVGLEMFRDIEKRWNRGQFGQEYTHCEDLARREHWNNNLGLGEKKVHEVRRLHNDVTFMDAFLTPELCEKLRLYTFLFDPKEEQYELHSRDFQLIKSKLLQMLTNAAPRPTSYS